MNQSDQEGKISQGYPPLEKKYPPPAYTKVNAYTHRASVQQIATLVLFLLQLILHSVFVAKPIIRIDNPILYIMWCLYYCVLLLMIVDYCAITCSDPVDRVIPDAVQLANLRLRSQKFKKQQQMHPESKMVNPYAMRYCEDCEHSVQMDSYHCWRCKRCVEKMDHHCKYLNNCIGGVNYLQFFRLLVSSTVFLLLGIATGLWVFIVTFRNEEVNKASINRWAVFVFMIYSLLLMLAVDSLLVFHCYISCCRRMTTVEYLFRDTPSNNSEPYPNMNSAAQLRDEPKVEESRPQVGQLRHVQSRREDKDTVSSFVGKSDQDNM